jgi:hypothetical protein
MIVGYEEFRIVLNPAPASPGGGAASWNVRLQKCPIPRLVGDKGPVASKLTKLELDGLRSESAPPSLAALRAAGQKVWASIMTPDLRAAFEVCYEEVARAHKSLRIVIVVLSPDSDAADPGDSVGFADLPFELLRRPENATLPRFVAADTITPISRGLLDEATASPGEVIGPLRILVVVADPRGDFPPIGADAERRAIRDALADSVRMGAVQLEFCERGTLQELRDRLAQGGWHVLHFAGHGGIELGDDGLPQAYLAFVDPDTAGDPLPKSMKVRAETLEYSLRLRENPTLKLMVLTSCAGAQLPPGPAGAGAPTPAAPRSSKRGFDSVAYHLMANAGINAAVAMQFDLETRAAEIFSRTFYGGARLLERPVDEILTEYRDEIIARFNEGHRAWANPTLLWRSRDGRVFNRVCGIGPDAQAELSLRKTLIEQGCRRLLELFNRLAGRADVLQQLGRFWKTDEDEVIDNVGKLAHLLGETIRPETAVASPGRTASSRLIVRPQRDVKIRSLKLEIRYPMQALGFVGFQPAAWLPASATLDIRKTGDSLQVIYFDTAPQDWPANTERDVARVDFSIPDNGPPGVYDLTVAGSPQVDSEPKACFNGVNGVVFVEPRIT